MALMTPDHHTLFPICCSSPEDMEYHAAFREDALLQPWYLRCEEANVLLHAYSGAEDRKQLAKTSDLRNQICLNLPWYHSLKPNGICFFITLNCPTDTGQFGVAVKPECNSGDSFPFSTGISESYARCAAYAKKIHNLPEKVLGHWKVGYIITGIETHKGKQWG